MKQRLNSTVVRAYLVLTLAALIWASNAIAGRIAAGHIGSATLTLARWTLAALVILPFMLPHLRRDWPVLRARLGYIGLMAASGFAGFNLALYTALQHTSAVLATIAQAGIPMLVLAAGAFLLRERITFLRVIGFCLTVIGITVSVSGGDLSQLRQTVGIGELWMFLAVVLYAGYSYGLRYRPKVHWLSFIGAMVWAAALFAVPFGLHEIAVHGLPPLTQTVVSLVVYTAVMASLVSQSAYADGVSRIGPSRASLFINAVPVFGAILAVLILREAYHWYHGVGLVLVMSGIALAERSARRNR